MSSPSERPGDPVDPPTAPRGGSPSELELQEQLVLSELLNRVLDRGVVVSGDVTISVAGIDLVYLALDVLLTSVETARETRVAARNVGHLPGRGDEE